MCGYTFNMSKSLEFSMELYLARSCSVHTSVCNTMWHTRDALHKHAHHEHTVCLIHYMYHMYEDIHIHFIMHVYFTRLTRVCKNKLD